MKGKRGKKKPADLEQAGWIKLPRTGQVRKKLDKNGVVHVKGENPEFTGTPYCVCLGLCVNEPGSKIRYGIPDSPMEGDYFYAEVQKKGSFDIHLKAQSLSNKDVTIVWCAIPQSTLGPTPIPTRPPGIGLTTVCFKAKDFPGRYVDEVPGIGPEFIRRLTTAGMKSLAALASADAKSVADILEISEVRAMGFIYEARLLLQDKTRK
jgi:hypothetical protein